jgi:hypothetical protein
MVIQPRMEDTDTYVVGEALLPRGDHPQAEEPRAEDWSVEE